SWAPEVNGRNRKRAESSADSLSWIVSGRYAEIVPMSGFASFLWRRKYGAEKQGRMVARMKGSSVVLLVSMISVVGCAGPVELLFKNSIVVDHLDGNYQRLASCIYE